ncbi:MAG: c-type cytochrome [Pyrinomonadaceae bacterium]|nr:c-type cytochrome [Pyrinomonadaceae bacterium]
MKQTIKLTISVIIILGGMLAVFANKTSTVTKLETAVPMKMADAVYTSNCARCHGADGKGNTQLGREYDVPDLTITARKMSLTRVKNIISKGAGDMPAFGKKLKAAQIASLASYVRGLR